MRSYGHCIYSLANLMIAAGIEYKYLHGDLQDSKQESFMRETSVQAF